MKKIIISLLFIMSMAHAMEENETYFKSEQNIVSVEDNSAQNLLHVSDECILNKYPYFGEILAQQSPDIVLALKKQYLYDRLLVDQGKSHSSKKDDHVKFRNLINSLEQILDKDKKQVSFKVNKMVTIMFGGTNIIEKLCKLEDGTLNDKDKNVLYEIIDRIENNNKISKPVVMEEDDQTNVDVKYFSAKNLLRVTHDGISMRYPFLVKAFDQKILLKSPDIITVFEKQYWYDNLLEHFEYLPVYPIEDEDRFKNLISLLPQIIKEDKEHVKSKIDKFSKESLKNNESLQDNEDEYLADLYKEDQIKNQLEDHEISKNGNNKILNYEDKKILYDILKLINEN